VETEGGGSLTLSWVKAIIEAENGRAVMAHTADSLRIANTLELTADLTTAEVAEALASLRQRREPLLGVARPGRARLPAAGAAPALSVSSPLLEAARGRWVNKAGKPRRRAVVIACGHHQRGFAGLVHAAEPAGVGRRLG
jgi:hypothetical protein